MIDAVLSAVYFFLIVRDFEYSESFYDFCVDDIIKSNEQRIDTLIKQGNDYFEDNAKEWFVLLKDCTIGLVQQQLMPMIID